MKTHNILSKITILAILIGLFVSSCEEEESFDFSKPFNDSLSGEIIQDMHLEEGDYRMTSATTIKEGATLTIDAGVTVTVAHNTPTLIVERGAKLIINGTLDHPVVFTADTMKAGSWGGIIVNGKAPVTSIEDEVLDYGGDDPEDNSGSITNLKIEYAGKNVYPLELNGVGRGTVVENVEISNCSKTGIDINEGTVEPKNIIIEEGVLNGEIFADLYLKKGEYELRGWFTVREGASLTIEAGTMVKTLTIEGDNATSAIVVEPGAKIFIEGTEEEPIVFTSEDMQPEAWGGIIIRGKAPVVVPDGETLNYGGDNENDNSGTIQHVILKYAGRKMFPLSLQGVGSETVVNNITLEECSRISIEIKDGTVEPQNLSINGGSISGNISMDTRLLNATYNMSSSLSVKEGATLTIEAGAVVTVENEEWPASLTVEKGAKLNINGNETNPVVFTSAEQIAGSWGGIKINGKAPVNVDNANYGGDDKEDNSGSIQYLRLEYAGMDTEYVVEMNAVGSNTTFENVEVYYCQKSAFGFKGGTVNAKYLMANGVGDTFFKWDMGWQGKGQFWLGYRNSSEITLGTWAGGITGDSGLDENMGNLLPISNPTISNVTIVNNEDAYGIMVFRTGTKGLLRNLVLTDTPDRGFQTWDALAAVHINSGQLNVDYTSMINIGSMGYHADVLQENKFEVSDNFIDEDPEIALTNGFVGTTSNGTDMSLVDSWFTSTNYKGAVSADNNWTEGWTK